MSELGDAFNALKDKYYTGLEVTFQIGHSYIDTTISQHGQHKKDFTMAVNTTEKGDRDRQFSLIAKKITQYCGKEEAKGRVFTDEQTGKKYRCTEVE